MSTAPGGLGRVRVWDLPTRALHWVLALSAFCQRAARDAQADA